MAKIADTNEKIAKAVTKSYKAVESAVVGGYRKIEDEFVDKFLAKEGETVEEASTVSRAILPTRSEIYECD